MLDVIEGVLVALAAVAAVPGCVLLLQVLAAQARRPSERAERICPTDDAGPIVVLVPAHDEESGIAATVASVRAQMRPMDRILVVADNCTDHTAQAARAAGADVVERSNAEQRGKGYALDFGVRAIAAGNLNPAVVIVVDADCVLGESALPVLSRLAAKTGRPVQSSYSMHPPTDASLGQRISAFAWIVRNRVRPLGAGRLGWPCQLMGTGMAFPWPLLERAPLASGHLVEDLQLGVALAQQGSAPLFCPQVEVTSTFPADRAAAVAQRTRWEHGHLSMIFRVAPRLLAAGIARGRPGLVGMALDLAVPPLALLVLMQGVSVGALAVFWLLTGRGTAVLIAGLGLAAVAMAVLLAWRQCGRGLLSASDLLGIPAYVISKSSIYRKWLVKRESAWIRTRR